MRALAILATLLGHESLVHAQFMTKPGRRPDASSIQESPSAPDAIPTSKTPKTPKLDASYCVNTATSRSCWGNYSIDTDYYVTTPYTGVTREYWLTAESTTLAPDGYEREVLVFNGSLPGPTIEADWGDEVVIHITNNIPDNGTSVHWHGVRQLNSIFSDGVPGVTQCPLAHGQTKTYRWRATQYGTSWYHSHFSLQLGEGLHGPIVIHGPATANYDIDIGPVVLQDWTHTSVFTIWELLQRKTADVQPVGENGLINGLNPYDCSQSSDPACIGTTERFELTFQKGKKYRLRIIGTQIDGWFKFTIDGHKLTVIANDFVPIEPYETDNIVLSGGERYDIIVEADQPVGNYWLRSIYQTACNRNDNLNKNNIRGIVRYVGADTSETPTTSVSKTITNSCGDEPYESLVPWVSHDVGSSDFEDSLGMTVYMEPDLTFKWTLRTKTLMVDWQNPTLLDIYRGDEKFPPESNVVTVQATNEWVYWILEDQTGRDIWHPMHLHGHDFYILAQGSTQYDSSVKLNTKNPPRRDTATLYGNGYLVIAFKTDNPGSWLIHCHIAFHASQGLALQLVERPAEIPDLIAADVDQLNETCRTWVPFYNSASQAHYKQDDSGI
ncbi:Cupredoxin [Truncatella angustata]|uniref:Cupredoxin n=1 Tax=Truncatella angustata TaxID=152316 RepID=A0A9P8UMC9_9PEZI|nr:Cupredoxin [Truncatella angustata]KAH6654743.1 Cupredoxin [Truncatella angustata]